MLSVSTVSLHPSPVHHQTTVTQNLFLLQTSHRIQGILDYGGFHICTLLRDERGGVQVGPEEQCSSCTDSDHGMLEDQHIAQFLDFSLFYGQLPNWEWTWQFQRVSRYQLQRFVWNRSSGLEDVEKIYTLSMTSMYRRCNEWFFYCPFLGLL